MKNLLIGLSVVTAMVSLLLVGFLVGARHESENKKKRDISGGIKPGDSSVSSTEISNPPPTVPPVNSPARVMESLKVGQTYRVRSAMTLNVRGTDENWGFKWQVGLINYWCKAEVARKILANDGTNIIEERTFRKVESSKLNTTLNNIRIDLGERGELLLGGAALLYPEAAGAFFTATKMLQGAILQTCLEKLGITQHLRNQLENDPHLKMFSRANQLQGKVVKIKYRNDRTGEVTVDPIKGDLSSEEIRFLLASSLLADCHIFPNLEVAVGDSWPVDGMHFVGMVDPSLLARTEGKFELRREKDSTRPRLGRVFPITCLGGELSFNESDERSERIGSFRPKQNEVEILFSPKDQLVVEAKMRGNGKISSKSRDHWLFAVRSDREPDIKMFYECAIEDEPGNTP